MALPQSDSKALIFGTLLALMTLAPQSLNVPSPIEGHGTACVHTDPMTAGTTQCLVLWWLLGMAWQVLPFRNPAGAKGALLR